MHVAVVRLSFCALLFGSLSKSNSQTPLKQDSAALDTHHGSWKLLHEENFEEPDALFRSGLPHWVPDTFQATDEYSDSGTHFKQLGITAPAAVRAEGSFGNDDWLTAAAYSRSNLTKFSDLFQVVPDPANPANHVLKISSPVHTDGIVVRPTAQLPPDTVSP